MREWHAEQFRLRVTQCFCRGRIDGKQDALGIVCPEKPTSMLEQRAEALLAGFDGFDGLSANRNVLDCPDETDEFLSLSQGIALCSNPNVPAQSCSHRKLKIPARGRCRAVSNGVD